MDKLINGIQLLLHYKTLNAFDMMLKVSKGNEFVQHSAKSTDFKHSSHRLHMYIRTVHSEVLKETQ